MSPSLRASVLNVIWWKTYIEQNNWSLLEDIIGMYFYKEFIISWSADVVYLDWGSSSQSDFLINITWNKIAFECW
jgi:hypothetical protein